MSSRYIIGGISFALFFGIILFGLQDFGIVQSSGVGVISSDEERRNSSNNVPNIPNVKLQTIHGERFSLLSDLGKGSASDLSNLPIILNFWASWCPPCVKEFPLLISKVIDNPGKVALVAISIDQSRGDMERFLEQFPQTQEYPDLIKVVWDPKSRIAQDKFNVIFLPETFIITRDGEIVSKIKGEVMEKDLAIIDELIN